ncbi:23S rRNA (adenine(2030)-N(6))-methyltransferase RlmJ [Escherichia coli]
MINPPWKLEQQMNNVLPWLHSKLISQARNATVSWIMPSSASHCWHLLRLALQIAVINDKDALS